MKYPNIEVELTGNDGHAISVMMKVKRALRKGGVSTEECEEYQKEALSGDYNNVLWVSMNWVDVT
jgi:hypothetical protein